MIFEILCDASEKGELLLVDGGLCHFHKRRDGQLTIREIIVLPGKQRQGIGSALLAGLRRVPDITSIYAKCPVDLPANLWYNSKGFLLDGIETTPSGRQLNLWRLPC